VSYKIILVHIDDTTRSPLRIKLAAELAIKHEAHLIAVADTGVSRFIYQDGNINGIDPGLLTHLEYLRERAVQNVADFKIQVANLGVTSFSGETTQDDAYSGIGFRARYCDLVIVGQTNPEETSPAVMNDFPEYMILNTGRPVMVVPYAGEFNQPGKRPLLAWDGSKGATRAITDAIPLLREAELAHIVIINPTNDVHGDKPGSNISAYLAHHGIKIDVSVHHTKIGIGPTLLSVASDLNSDLIVMGGYGHSRLKEMIMGGATNTMLKNMTIPVLFSH
jgi:nucleotide-binding universal stress UspA family protein